MATTSALMTVAEFLALPEDEGKKMELIEGELIVMGSAKRQHEIVKAGAIKSLVVYETTHPHVTVMFETMYVLGQSSPIPDASVILTERLAPANSDFFDIAPEIAIEVVSSETAEALMGKVRVYLKHGVRAVWLLYPVQRCVMIFDAQGQRMLEGDDVLEQPDVLPGFRVLISDFFNLLVA